MFNNLVISCNKCGRRHHVDTSCPKTILPSERNTDVVLSQAEVLCMIRILESLKLSQSDLARVILDKLYKSRLV